VLTVARECIGKILVHRSSQGLVAGRIVETEAYRGPEDRAAHSFGGRRTARTEVMYGPPGYAYVFFVYGMHFHFNIVTTREGAPHAVLVRAVEPLRGVRLMAARRELDTDDLGLTSGPGKLCEAFAIDRRDYGADLCKNRLFLSDGPRPKLARSPRIGIDYAEEWAEKPWRFCDPESRYVSQPRARVRKAPRA
jgi:DNA-3-methyladenine glycosylase